MTLLSPPNRCVHLGTSSSGGVRILAGLEVVGVAELDWTVASDQRWGTLPLLSSFFSFTGDSFSAGSGVPSRRLKNDGGSLPVA